MTNWTLHTPSKEFLDRVKINEGSQTYQCKLGYYKNGKFWVYKDSLGYPTIGYGHLVVKGENFSNGLTEEQAHSLLIKDCGSAFECGQLIAEQYKLEIPESIQEMLVEMVFQLGKNGVLKFKKFLAALAKNDYARAIVEVKDSTWYKQTPNRVKGHISVLTENIK